MNENIRALTAATEQQALTQGLVRCGFELECQANEGHRYSQFMEWLQENCPTCDKAKLDELVRAAMYTMWHDDRDWPRTWHDFGREGWNTMLSHISAFLRGKGIEAPNLVRSAITGNVSMPASFAELLRLAGVTETPTLAEMGILRTHMDTSMFANYKTHLQRDYPNQCRDPRYEGMDARQARTAAYLGFAAAQFIDMGSDGTVGGVEYRTRGGLTFDQFTTAAQAVFSKTATIDKRCSFHIHLSVPGVDPRYGERFQQGALEFLVENSRLFPSSVRERFHSNNAEWYEQYFSPSIGGEKYHAVAYRGATWEFRLWGNVKTVADAQQCLLLSVGALQHAARVATGQARLKYVQELFDQDDTGYVAERFSNPNSVIPANMLLDKEQQTHEQETVTLLATGTDNVASIEQRADHVERTRRSTGGVSSNPADPFPLRCSGCGSTNCAGVRRERREWRARNPGAAEPDPSTY